MSNNLRQHARADKVKWVIAFALILILIAGVTLALVKLFYQPPCKHEYEEGKCKICGAAELPEEETPDTVTVAYNFVRLNNETLGVMTSGVSGMSSTSENNGIITTGIYNSVTFTNNYDRDGTFVFSTSEAYQWSVSFGGYTNTLKGSCNTGLPDPDGYYASSSFTVRPNDLIQQGKINFNTQYTVNYTYQAMTWVDMGDMGQSGYVIDTIAGSNGVVSESCGTFMIQKVTDLPPTPSKTGYTFTGWYTDAACTNRYTDNKVVGDITLYAGFNANTYSVKFNANGGTGTMANQTMTYDNAVNLSANTFAKDKYAFKGWATSAEGAVVYTNGQSVKNLASAQGATVNLFAVWERSEWTVTFDVEGNKTTASCVVNAAVTLPSAPTKEGYNFVGWFMLDGTQYIDQPITADITLTARFAIIRCTVTFIVDGEVYSYYECDYGTNLSELLEQQVNPALFSVEGEYSPNF